MNRAYVMGSVLITRSASQTVNPKVMAIWAQVVSGLTAVVALILTMPTLLESSFGYTFDAEAMGKVTAVSVIVWVLSASIFVLTRWFYRLPKPVVTPQG